MRLEFFVQPDLSFQYTHLCFILTLWAYVASSTDSTVYSTGKNWGIWRGKTMFLLLEDIRLCFPAGDLISISGKRKNMLMCRVLSLFRGTWCLKSFFIILKICCAIRLPLQKKRCCDFFVFSSWCYFTGGLILCYLIRRNHFTNQ